MTGAIRGNVAGMATWVLDLDGVLWRGSEAIRDSPWAVRTLIEHGHDVVYCTNHARSPSVKDAELAGLGFPAASVVTSGEAAASVCSPADKVLVLGHPSFVELVAASGAETLDVFDVGNPAEIDGVSIAIVGGTDRWDRDRVGLMGDAVRAGARLLATNTDPTYPVTGQWGPRLLPGNGALVAAVETTAGAAAESTGKPNQAMVDLVTTRHGAVDIVVGDRPDTDGGLAAGLGARFALVLSGVTTPTEVPADPAPAVVAVDLAAVVESELGVERPR